MEEVVQVGVPVVQVVLVAVKVDVQEDAITVLVADSCGLGDVTAVDARGDVIPSVPRHVKADVVQGVQDVLDVKVVVPLVTVHVKMDVQELVITDVVVDVPLTVMLLVS